MSTPAPASAQAPPAFAALRNRDFALFFIGNMLSMMADNIEHVISYGIVYQAFRSETLQGFAVISHWMPALFFSWYFGALADRLDCRRIMEWSQILFISVSLAWALLFYTGRLEMWHSALLLTLHGMAGALWNPARQLMIYDVVGPETLQSGIRLLATGRQLGILFGPAVGGATLWLLKPTRALLVNALVYLPLMVWCRLVPYTGHGSGRQTTKGSWAEALSALWGASNNRILLSMILLVGFYAFFVGNAFQALMPAFALSLGAEDLSLGYAMLFAANGAGAVAGGLLLEIRGLFTARASTAIILAMLWCCAMTAFAVSTNYVLSLLFLFLAGILNLAFLSMAQTLVQLEAPANLRGRLIGLYNMAAQGLRTFSGVTVGFAGAYVGIQWSLGLSTLVVMAIAAALFVITARGVRTPKPAAG